MAPKAKAKAKAKARTGARGSKSQKVKGKISAGKVKVSAGVVVAMSDVRRRLTFKQPPPAIVPVEPKPEQEQELPGFHSPDQIFIRRSARLSQKGPARGHYDVLHVARTATALQIRDAFRQRALGTHPDKGGRPEDFRAVVNAFEILSDGARRLDYDNSLLRSGNTDGMSEDGLSSAAPYSQDAFAEHMATRRLMRDALTTLVALKRPERVKKLRKLSTAVLQSTVQWLDMISRHGKEMLHDPAFGEQGAVSSQGMSLAGVLVDKLNRYSVEVSWEGMKFRTNKTRSLAEVIDWHITLTQLKATAQARLRTAEAQGADESGAFAMTEEELALGYQASPTMRLSFVSHHLSGKMRVIAPTTQDLSLANQLKHRFSKLLKKGYSLTTKKSESSTSASDRKLSEGVSQLKRDAVRLTQKEKVDREKLENQLMQDVTAELTRRGVAVLREVPSVVKKPVMSVAADTSDKIDLVASAMKLRNLLQLDHDAACKVVATLKNFSLSQIDLVRGILLGQKPPLGSAAADVKAPEAKPSKKRRTDSTATADDLGPRTSPFLASADSKPDVVICTTLALSVLPDWCALRTCCSSVKVTVDDEFARHFKDFVYSDALFQWESRSTYSRRARPTSSARLASRFTKFLSSAHHALVFEHLDLGSAPMMALQDENIRDAVAKMSHLQDLVFPNHGWSSGADRAKFLSSLPEGASAWGHGRP